MNRMSSALIYSLAIKVFDVKVLLLLRQNWNVKMRHIARDKQNIKIIRYWSIGEK